MALRSVVMNLPEEAVRHTLRFVATHPPGSGIVFDFVYLGEFGLELRETLTIGGPGLRPARLHRTRRGTRLYSESILLVHADPPTS
jgi:O-methyltransferase involved in polyketide biosynthesis